MNRHDFLVIYLFVYVSKHFRNFELEIVQKLDCARSFDFALVQVFEPGLERYENKKSEQCSLFIYRHEYTCCFGTYHFLWEIDQPAFEVSDTGRGTFSMQPCLHLSSFQNI